MSKFFIACVSCVLMVFVVGCEKMDVKKAADDKADDTQIEQNISDGDGENEGATAIMAPTSAATIVIGDNAFTVEVAKTPEERARGLMNRESLAQNAGMWFIFPEMGDEKFWMKDTLIALDLVYVDDDMKVVHIIENAVPESTELLSSPSEFQYVLEIAAGMAEERGIKTGDVVQYRIGPQ